MSAPHAVLAAAVRGMWAEHIETKARLDAISESAWDHDAESDERANDAALDTLRKVAEVAGITLEVTP